MNFTNPGLGSLLSAWMASADARERAEALNIKFEERLSQSRLTEFESSLTGHCADYMALRGGLSDFVRTYIEVAIPHVPPTFSSANNTAKISPLSPEQKLVRIENVTRHLVNSDLTAEDLKRSLSGSTPSAVATADSFVDRWNLARDSRPSFSAFKD